MIQTEQQILESIRALPPERRDRVLRAALTENDKRIGQNGSREEVAEQSARFRKAQSWIDAHKVEFDGKWVCLDGDQLIAHGDDGLEVYRDAKAKGIKVPFIERIKAVELPFGGW